MKAITRMWSAILLAVAGAGIAGALDVKALYGIAIAKYGPPIAPLKLTTVTIHGDIKEDIQKDGKEETVNLKDITVQVVNRGMQAVTDDKGHYTLTLELSEGDTVQVLAVDVDKQANNGDFSSAVSDVTLNTKNQSTTDDADQTVDFTLQPKPEVK